MEKWIVADANKAHKADKESEDVSEEKETAE
jgi:hypothetical protein